MKPLRLNLFVIGLISNFCMLILLACASTMQDRYGETLPETVAVWKLENSSPLSKAGIDFGELFTDVIVEVVKKKNRYRTVERDRLLLVLEELNLSSTSLVDEATKLDVGRMLGAQLFVFGGYQIVAGGMRVDLRLVNVATGQILNAVSHSCVQGGMDAWLGTVRQAALDLI